MMKVHKIDDYTVELELLFPTPRYCSLYTWAEENAFYLPKHYLKQFHPRYKHRRIGPLAKAEGFETWWQLWSKGPDLMRITKTPKVRYCSL